MIKKTYNIVLKIGREDIVTAPAILVQNDKDVYSFNIKVFDGIEEIDYTQVSDATITFALKNGAVVQSDPDRMTITEDSISYDLGTSEIAYPGMVLASVQLFGADDERLTTAKFKFLVQNDLITPGAVKSDSNFPLLQQLLADIEQLKQDIVNLQVSDGSLLDVKLSNASDQIKARVASHLADNAAHSETVTELTLLNGCTHPFPGYELILTRVGKIVHLYGSIQIGTATEGTVFVNLPVGFRINRPTQAVIFKDNIKEFGEILLQSDGNITLRSGFTTGEIYAVNISWVAA